ncbi:uncharacterized protein LOC116197270 [Punica granatum]|uniref:Uncharacterized protein n=2 Tax=Punica granatum TaxID=22663 RepID=A0A218X2E5_PUNGR|nr:uncharacterized protein LOC116189981 [Punica granatum]XP_031383220.1 uncharacterized protein LOC116197270 [Punica granatum]OWM79167.1 hypothetical protein CDL15_Pgr003338 [Punica granatum]PKI71376.1 hypothetical protein CRG98_008235 [Punica granatum]
MASLNSGVLVKLLEDMNAEEAALDDRKPALLQIRSIIPVLAEGDLWPNQGFYLKVSDASHAMYVSLPHDQDEFVLCNKLHLGQFIYADRLETSYPVPLLVGVRPYLGRNSCTGARKGLISIDNLVEIGDASNQELVKEVIKDAEEKPRMKVRSTSTSGAVPGIRTVRNMAQKSSRERDLSDSDCSRKVDRDSDTESTISTCSSVSRISKRRSWNDADNSRLDEILEIPSIRRRLKPIRHSPSSSSSVVHLRHDSTVELPISKALRKSKSVLSPKASRNLKSNKVSATSKKTTSEVSLDQTAIFSSLNNRTRTEDTIVWASLPSSLLMLGKEVLKRRDAALLASMEALQEAAAAERLLKCLSAYSELQAANSEDRETEALVDQFFNLQDDLSRSRLIVESLNIRTRSKSSEPEEESNKDVLRVASERTKNAQSWIKAALASDLTTPTSTEKASDYDNSLKGTCTSRKLSSYEPKVKLGSSDRKLEWSRGSSLCATGDLASSLQNESRALFLVFVEQYLDGLRHRFSQESSNAMVGTMLQIKKVSDWIDLMAKKEANCLKSGSKSDDSEFDIYGRVKNKIYRILLMHIEKTAMVWEDMSEASVD